MLDYSILVRSEQATLMLHAVEILIALKVAIPSSLSYKLLEYKRSFPPDVLSGEEQVLGVGTNE